MPKLVLMRDNVLLREIPLDKQDITAGRSPDNEVPLDDDAVSRRHLRFITILNDCFLEDLNSTNGTYVNGKLTKKHALQNGDVVLAGRHQFKYVVEEAGGDENDFDKTMVMSPGKIRGITPDAPPAGGMGVSDGDAEARSVASMEGYSEPDPGAPPSNRGRLTITSGAHAGKNLPLDKAMTNIGRAGQQVAAISRRPKGFFLIHVESGIPGVVPKINGVELPANGQQLQEDDLVQIANIEMQFHYVM